MEAQAPVVVPEQTTAPAAPAAVQNVSSDDFFNDNSSSSTQAPAPAVAPAVTTPPTVAPATAAPATATPPATTADALPATIDPNDPWAGTEFDTTTTTPPAPAGAPDERVNILAQTLQLDQLPETPEAMQQALANEIARQVGILTHDPVRLLDQQIALGDEDLVRAMMLDPAIRQPFQTNEDIEEAIDKMVADGRLAGAAKTVRDKLTSNRDTAVNTRNTEIVTQQQQQAEQQRQQRDAYNESLRKMNEATDNFKDPTGKPLPDAVRSGIKQYITSQEYFNDFFNQPESYHVERALELNPKTSARYAQMKAAFQRTLGESGILKELEQSQPILGGGSPATAGVQKVSSDDFFNNN